MDLTGKSSLSIETAFDSPGETAETTPTSGTTVHRRWGDVLRLIGLNGHRFPGAGELRDVVEAATSVGQSLLTVSKEFEVPFLTLGESLEAITVEADALTREIRETAALLSPRGQTSALADLENIVTGARADLDRVPIGHTSVQHIGTVVEQLENVRALCAQVEEIAEFFGMVGLNMAIESARIRSTSVAFSTVADEIKQIRQQAVAIAETIRVESEATLHHQKTAREQIETDLTRLGTLTAEANREVGTSLAEIHRLIASALGILNEATASAREVSADVGEVVAGIQVHDSMHQRIQHIAAALGQLSPARATNEAESGTPGAPPINPHHALHSILLLQAEQLGQIIRDVRAVQETQQRSFDGIHDRVTLLATQLRHIGGRGDLPAPGRAADPLESLYAAVVRLRHLLGESHRLLDGALDTAGRAAAAAGQMGNQLTHIREIGREVKLKSLNAILRSLRIGHDGRPLQVLAQCMRNFSAETDSFVERAGGVIQSVVRASRAQEDLLREHATHAGAAAAAHSALGETLQNTATLFDQFRQGSNLAIEHAATLARQILQARDAIDFVVDLADELSRARRNLEAMARRIAPAGFGSISGAADRLARRYTTRQETDVHHQVVRLGTAQPVGSCELPWAAAARPVSAAVGAHGGNGRGTFAHAATPELGDNVELF